jgi:hypothetical protein
MMLLLWLLGYCGYWAAVAAGLLWLLGYCGCWIAVAAGLLWLLGYYGCWFAAAAGLLWRLGCCSGTNISTTEPVGRHIHLDM